MGGAKEYPVVINASIQNASEFTVRQITKLNLYLQIHNSIRSMASLAGLTFFYYPPKQIRMAQSVKKFFLLSSPIPPLLKMFRILILVLLYIVLKNMNKSFNKNVYFYIIHTK